MRIETHDVVVLLIEKNLQLQRKADLQDVTRTFFLRAIRDPLYPFLFHQQPDATILPSLLLQYRQRNNNSH